jgi:hypothetical protein
MAGDWIKIRHALPRSGHVVRIMSACDADKLRTLGGLVSALLLFDEQTQDGHLSGYSLKAFDETVGLTGLGAALCDPKVGWMEVDEDGLTLLDWDKHNGSSAKRRANDATRKANKRSEKPVRILSEKKRTVCGPEKRREEKNIINSLSARAREDPVLDLDQDARQEASVVIPPCTKNEADQFGAQTGIPGDLVAEWYEKHDSNDWRPYGGNPPMTTKSWKFDLKNFWKHRKAKDDERRNAGTSNQRNGAEAVGKVRINAANDRNNFVDQATLDAYARKDRIKEIADLIGLWINTERWGSCTTLHEWYDDPLMPDIISFIREKDEQLFNKISKLGFIDAESGRWTGPTRPTR